MSRRYVIPEMATGSTPVQNTPQPNQPFSNGPPVQQPTQSRQLLFPWANPKLLNPETLPNQIGFPPYMRSITGLLPASKQICDTCKIPFGIVLTPNLISECPVVDESQQEEVFRCGKCSAHLCPQVQVDPMGETWKCGICGYANKIKSANPNDYYPSAQKFQSRTELQSLVYDIIAPSSYKTALEDGPGFCFLIDMSYPALSIGFTQQMLTSIKASLDSLPPQTHVGIVTMSNIATAFDLADGQEIVFADLKDLPLPFYKPNAFLPISECKSNFIQYIDDLLSRPMNPDIIGNCLASGMSICDQIMQRKGGILMVGTIGLPKYGPHPLKERRISNNDELALLRLPEDQSGRIFRDIGFKLNRSMVSVHQFSAGTQYMDLTTICVPAGLTCGKYYHYRTLDDAGRSDFHTDIFRTLTGQYLWSTYIRLRSTPSYRLVRPHTNCALRKNDLISLPVIGRDDSIVFEITATEKENTVSTVLFQFSMPYTNNSGVRMIRVFNVEIPLSTDINSIYASVDEGALVTMINRQATSNLLQKGPIPGKELTMKQIQTICSIPNVNLSSFYHLVHSMMCNSAFRDTHPFGVDGRMLQVIGLRVINVKNLILYLYPRMFSVDTGTILPLTGESFAHGTVFLFHTISKIYIWVSDQVDPNFLINAFGCQTLDQLPTTFPPNNPQYQPNPASPEYQKLQNIIQGCWELSGMYLLVEVIGKGSPRESVFSEIIVDDAKLMGSDLNQWINSLRLSVF